MNTFNFCWSTLAIESGKNNVFLNKDNCSVQNNNEEEFDKPIKRVSYLCKYGSFNIHFFNHCFSSFITEVPDSSEIINKICVAKDLNICSLSTGPGTYVIGFLYALHLLGKSLTRSVNYKFITKHVAWRNMVCEMLGSVPLNVPKPKSCKLIQCDDLTEINPKAQNYIKIADVLFLCHTFSSTKGDTDEACRVSNDILKLLKPGVLVFFIFNEDISKNLKELITCGHFLYGPTEITLKDMPYDKTIPTVLQVPVVDSGSSFFGVWQKSGLISNQEQSSTVKLLAVPPVSLSPEPLKDINSIIKSDRTQSSISKLKDSFKLANTSTYKLSSENLSIESTESSATSVSTEPKLICSNKAYFVKKVSGGMPTKSVSELKDSFENANVSTPDSKAKSSEKVCNSTESNTSIKDGSTEPILICGKQANFVKKMPCGLFTSTDFLIGGQKNEPPKDNRTNTASSLHSLVKTLERLVTNLEEFNSQNVGRNTHNQQCCFTCSCQNVHAQSWNMRHNFNGCVRNRCHSPCVESHHICSNSCNYCNCSMSSQHNFCRNVGSQTPRIVIPLPNTTETVLAQVFSLVSQVNNSSK